MTERLTIAQARRRIADLEGVIRDTLWMARRYAHGRQTYAVGMYNSAARVADRMGVAGKATDGSIFALDGTKDGLGSPSMSGLSEHEFAEAAAGLNAAGITEHPDRFSAYSIERMRRERIADGMSLAGRRALAQDPDRTRGGEHG